MNEHWSASDLKPKEYKMSEHVSFVYQSIFYHDMKWPSDGPVIVFMGERIHYAEFIQAVKGELK